MNSTLKSNDSRISLRSSVSSQKIKHENTQLKQKISNTKSTYCSFRQTTKMKRNSNAKQ
jgi:hypothetical protein